MRKTKKKNSIHKIAPPLKVRKNKEGGYCIIDNIGIVIADDMTKDNANLFANYYAAFGDAMGWLKAVVEQDIYMVPNERVPSKYHKLRKIVLQRAIAFLEYFGWEVEMREVPTRIENEAEVVSVEKVLFGRIVTNNDEQYQ